MSALTRRPFAYVMWVLALFGMGTGITIGFVGGWPVAEPLTGVLLFSIVFSYATVGLMLVLRVPDNRIGWTFLVGGDLGAAYVVAFLYFEAGWGQGWPAVGYAFWVSQAVYIPMILCLVALPLLLFPDGRIPSPRWGWVRWLIATVVGLAITLSTITPGWSEDWHGSSIYVPNPLGGTEALTRFDPGVLLMLALALVGISLLVPAAAMVYRFVRSKGVERLQLKWAAYSATMAGAGLATYYTTEELLSEPPLLNALGTVALLGVLGIPITAGMAVVRYRLYDIDRLISRTITYTLLVGLLGAIYALGVFLLGSLAFEGDLPVALSTLGVATLFNPLRHRLQAILDRRFSRTGYIPQEVNQEFGHRVQNQVNPDTLNHQLLDVVDETLAPTSAAIWIRQPTHPD